MTILATTENDPLPLREPRFSRLLFIKALLKGEMGSLKEKQELLRRLLRHYTEPLMEGAHAYMLSIDRGSALGDFFDQTGDHGDIRLILRPQTFFALLELANVAGLVNLKLNCIAWSRLTTKLPMTAELEEKRLAREILGLLPGAGETVYFKTILDEVGRMWDGSFLWLID